MKQETFSKANGLSFEITQLKSDIEKLQTENRVVVRSGRGCTPDLWSIGDYEDSWIKRGLLKRFRERLKKAQAEFEKL